MAKDPIIAEIRKAGEELAQEAGGDIHKFFDNLRTAQKKYGDRLVKHIKREPAVE